MGHLFKASTRGVARCPSRVIIAGAGGVGFWLALALNREIGKDIPVLVYDPDNFKGGNGHQRLPKVTNNKTLKIDCLMTMSHYMMGDDPPVMFGAKFTGAEAKPGDLVIDCTDATQAARKKMWTEAQAQGAELIRISYDGVGIVVVAGGCPIAAPKDKGGYANVPSLPLSFLAGGLGAEIVLRRIRAGVIFDDIQLELKLPEGEQENVFNADEQKLPTDQAGSRDTGDISSPHSGDNQDSTRRARVGVASGIARTKPRRRTASGDK